MLKVICQTTRIGIFLFGLVFFLNANQARADGKRDILGFTPGMDLADATNLLIAKKWECLFAPIRDEADIRARIRTLQGRPLGCVAGKHLILAIYFSSALDPTIVLKIDSSFGYSDGPSTVVKSIEDQFGIQFGGEQRGKLAKFKAELGGGLTLEYRPPASGSEQTLTLESPGLLQRDSNARDEKIRSERSPPRF